MKLKKPFIILALMNYFAIYIVSDYERKVTKFILNKIP